MGLCLGEVCYQIRCEQYFFPCFVRMWCIMAYTVLVGVLVNILRAIIVVINVTSFLLKTFFEFVVFAILFLCKLVYHLVSLAYHILEATLILAVRVCSFVYNITFYFLYFFYACFTTATDMNYRIDMNYRTDYRD